jgi:IMP dehydrogenase
MNENKDKRPEEQMELGLTFDDVLLLPCYSETLPAEVDTRTRFSRRIEMNIPITSAAMDTVTEGRTAIALAQEGGIGVIHRNLTPEEQAGEVDKVKKSESGMIADPITLPPEAPVGKALELMAHYHISGVPVTKDGHLVGILTNRDLRFEVRTDIPIEDVMTRQPLITAPLGTTLEEAREILQKHRIEKLPLVDENDRLMGLITVKDIVKKIKFPKACKDSRGRLRAAAADGTSPDLERAERLISAGVDVLVVDTAHGYTRSVFDKIKLLKKKFPEVDIVAGNVASEEATRDLVKLGVDGIKIGMGPGSICTTRVVSGMGVPQITAIFNCVRGLDGNKEVPLIADGGIRYSGDVTKALAAGASSVMLGSLLAGTEEAPGEMIHYRGRTFKVYRGMGSLGAMEEGSAERYFQPVQTETQKFVPEGVEGRVPYKGSLAGLVYQMVGGLRSGMGYLGAGNIEQLQKNARFIRISSAGEREGHPHDIIITKEAPNYMPEL